MDEFDHDLMRKQLARQGYINWRMRDLPAIYQNLMPVSFKGGELWAAEKAIRSQYEADQAAAVEMTERPIGPACNLIDYRDMSAHDKITFSLEVSKPKSRDQLTPGEAASAESITNDVETLQKRPALKIADDGR